MAIKKYLTFADCCRNSDAFVTDKGVFLCKSRLVVSNEQHDHCGSSLKANCVSFVCFDKREKVESSLTFHCCCYLFPTADLWKWMHAAFEIEIGRCLKFYN